MKKVDMSEQAILRRLKTVDQLRELCLSLMKAKKDSDAKAGLIKNPTAKKTFVVEKQIEIHIEVVIGAHGVENKIEFAFERLHIFRLFRHDKIMRSESSRVRFF